MLTRSGSKELLTSAHHILWVLTDETISYPMKRETKGFHAIQPYIMDIIGWFAAFTTGARGFCPYRCKVSQADGLTR